MIKLKNVKRQGQGLSDDQGHQNSAPAKNPTRDISSYSSKQNALECEDIQALMDKIAGEDGDGDSEDEDKILVD